MRRRRWARAAALCLAIAVALQLAVHGAGAAAAGTTFSRRARGGSGSGTPPKGLPPASPASGASLPAHHDAPVPRARGSASRRVPFDAAAAGARCKNSTAGKPAAVGRRAAACAGVFDDDDDDDDKRVVPTGPNPLHNR